jgi:hypothetical protein
MSCSIVFFLTAFILCQKQIVVSTPLTIKRAEICDRLGYYVSQNGIRYRNFGANSWILEDGNVQEESVSHLHSGGSLKSRII